MIETLIAVLVLLVVLGLVYYLITMIPLPPPFQVIARVVFILICILVVLWLFAPTLAGIHRPLG